MQIMQRQSPTYSKWWPILPRAETYFSVIYSQFVETFTTTPHFHTPPTDRSAPTGEKPQEKLHTIFRFRSSYKIRR